MSKRQKFCFFLFLFFFIFSQFIFIGEGLATVKKKVVKSNPARILTYFVTDDAGRSLQRKNENKVVPIASLAKMMSAIIFTENRTKEWNEKIVYNPKKHFIYGNYLKLKKGDEISIKDLLYSTLVASVNESPQMLIDATNLDPTNFVLKMNEKARALGLAKTRYIDVSGISPKNISTSVEQVKLLEEVYKYPELKEVMEAANYEFDVNNIKGEKVHHSFKNTNSLMSQKTDFAILASKTGYLWEAKNNLAMVIQKNGRIFYSVTMGDPSRFGDYSNTEMLLNKALSKQVSARF